MSIETRSSSALFKRAEQLKRWEQSDTNREPVSPKQKSRKIKFSSGCVFLAACAAADKEEVLRLLQKGADINTANVDGLTALHQACIDDNLDMVEFLVEHAADVNRGDNEGWTPLHATASCGFKSIAKYLLENGANVAAINNDGELALDIAEEHSMEELLRKEIEEKGVDCDEARFQEEGLMLRDAREWLNAGGDQVNLPHPKTGATALHVAAAKGYMNVMNLLLQCKSEVDKQDNDGWTPIHAAAHWSQFDAAKLLADNLADMDMKNYVGQTAFDVADTAMFRHLEDLKKRQNKEELTKKKQLKKKTDAKGRQPEAEQETPTKVKRVEVEIEENEKVINSTENTVDDMDLSSSDSESESSSSEAETSDNSTDDEKKNRVNSLTDSQRIPTKDQNSVVNNSVTPPTSPVKTPVTAVTLTATPAAPTIPPPRQIVEPNSDDNMPSWRRPGSFRTRVNSDNKNLNLRIDNKDKSPTSGTPPEAEITLRRTQSFQSDPKFYARYVQLRERIKANSFHTPLISSALLRSPTSASLENLTNHRTPMISDANSTDNNRSPRMPQFARNTAKDSPTENAVEEMPVVNNIATTNSVPQPTTVTNSPTKVISPVASPQPNNQVRSTQKPPVGAQAPSTPTTPGGTKLSPGNIFKNFFKSFVPPVRDEESETQRKAHAKRVRETRRSTQGVTLDEIKSAEQLNKKKNQSPTLNNNNELLGANGDSANNGASVTATITTAAPTVPQTATTALQSNNRDTSATSAPDEPVVSHERRPSWRLRVDNGSKFKLEDATKTPDQPSSTVYVRRPAVNSIQRPASAPVDPVTPAAEATVTLSLRRPKSQEEKDQDKENDARNAQATLATQAAIQRRRRPKRRSTGVVHVDMDEIDPDRQDPGAGGDFEEPKTNQESGSEKSNRSSRLGAVSDLAMRGENGELDYKKMYESAVSENDRLRDKLRKSDEELRDTKQTLEKINTVTSKNSLSELEKRERRAMERKLSEMEEELKQLEVLKTENQRLKEENGALIRVISKLSK